MNTYQYKNITLNIHTLEWVDITGETYIVLPSKVVARLIAESCTFVEFFIRYQMEELWDELEQDEDKAEQHFLSLGEDVEIHNADAIIAVYAWLLESGENMTIEVHSEHISWPIHDLLHGEHDEAGCTIYTDAQIEEQRILKSFEVVKNQFPQCLPTFEFCEKLEDEFYQRFSERLDLEDYKYPENYEEF